RGTVSVPAPGIYTVWIGGSLRSKLTVLVDGHAVGSVRDQLSETGQYSSFGQIALSAGDHRVELRYAGPGLAPGSAAEPEPLGPLALSRGTTSAPIRYVTPTHARSLCG